MAATSSVDESKEGSAYVAGEVLVTFKDSADSASAKQTLDSAVTVKDGQAEQKKTVTDDIVVAKVTDGATVSQAVNELSKDSDVESVQPNYIYHLMDDDAEDGAEDGTGIQATTEDPLQSTITAQTDLAAQAVTINDPSASSQWQLKDENYGVKCYSAWQYATASGSITGNTPIGVAVIDTGCLITHEDLANNIATGSAYNAYAAATGTGSTSDVTGTNGHGTHVAGIISARTNNSLGGSGVANNAKIIPIKACDANSSFDTSYLVAAYTYLINNRSTYNIKVVNMSIGGWWENEPSSGYGSDTGDAALLKKIDAANNVGILTVCAAGNRDTSQQGTSTVPYNCYPGDYATCVSVINLQSDATRASGSNYNSTSVSQTSSNGTKDISAPGTYIYSTYNGGTSSYATLSGTSMASPVVAGVAALIYSTNQSLTPAQVKSILYETATDLGDSGWDRTFGYGEVNAYYAVADALDKWISNDNCTVSNETFTGSSLKTTVQVNGVTLTEDTDYTATYSNNINAGTATVIITGVGNGGYAGKVTKTFTINPKSLSSATISSIADQAYTGSAITPTPTVTLGTETLSEDTDYTLSYSNNTNVGTATVTVTGTGNYTGTASETFTITAASISNATISSIANQTYTGSALKPALTVTWNGKTLTAGTDYTVSYTNNTDVGTATVTITGKGNFASSSTATATFTIVHASVVRLWGSTSLDTMQKIVTAGWSSGDSDTVVIATSEGYWDALSACGLAGLSDSPVIITNGSSLSTQAKEEIKATGASKAIVVGGTGAITPAVVSQIKLAGISSVTRYWGNSAADTSRAIYQGGSGWGKTCVIATSDGFQDALAAAPFSYAQHAPMFLAESGTTNQHVLSSSTLAAIKAGGFTKVVIMGGKYAVSTSVELQLSTIGLSGSKVTRMAGDTAYDTCNDFDAYAIGQGMTTAEVGLATGENYPDALCGAALCGKNNSIIALASTSDYTVINGVVKANASSVCQPYIFGGTGVVTDKMAAAFAAAIG